MPTFGIFSSCEGKCLRSFHATKEAGRESDCESLGYTNEQVDVRYDAFFTFLHFCKRVR